MTLVILAAGMGSRFGGLKQVEAIDESGNFIIDYSIYDAIKCGFNKVVFVIKRENYEIFKETVGKRVERYIKVEYAFQDINDLPKGFKAPEKRVKPWGTAHALYSCRNVVDENFAVISSDDFYGRDAFQKLYDQMSNSNEFCLIGYKIGDTINKDNTVKRGVCKLNNNNLVEIVESEIEYNNGKIIGKPLAGGEDYSLEPTHPVSMLMFGLTPLIFELIGNKMETFFKENKDLLDSCEFYLPDILTEYIRSKGNIKVIPTTAKWYGITYKEDLESLKSEIKRMKEIGLYKNNLWED